jgi:hypothetical protein
MSSRFGDARVWLGAVVAAAAALEIFVRRAPDATFLVALTFFTMVVQGCVALGAVGELTKGVWLFPVRGQLFAVYPLLLVAALLSLVLGVEMRIYPWTEAHPSIWLDERFFLIRNFIVHLAAFLAARKLVLAVRRGSERKNRWAGVYIALFIVAQSFVAFDWIMPLEYPWVSTLLGGFFFIESFLMGLAVTAFVLLFRMRRPGHGLTESLRDTSMMMFGFSVMWVGFFFAQFLVIWYGNIPEEVAVVLERVRRPPYAGLSRAVLFLVWVIPFIVLLSRPLKTVPPVMAGVASLILAGLFIEKIVLVLPVAGVNPVALAAETLLLLAPVALLVARAESVATDSVTSAANAPPAAG